jgi:hypothetical protein
VHRGRMRVCSRMDRPLERTTGPSVGEKAVGFDMLQENQVSACLRDP